jgi:hypothetical protein
MVPPLSHWKPAPSDSCPSYRQKGVQKEWMEAIPEKGSLSTCKSAAAGFRFNRVSGLYLKLLC